MKTIMKSDAIPLVFIITKSFQLGKNAMVDLLMWIVVCGELSQKHRTLYEACS